MKTGDVDATMQVEFLRRVIGSATGTLKQGEAKPVADDVEQEAD